MPTLTATLISTSPLTLKLHTPQANCSRCAEGMGCGQQENAWFRARLPEIITLPKRFVSQIPTPLSPQQTLTLVINHPHSLTQAALISYGLPLLGLFTGLLLGATSSEIGQLGLSALGIVLGAWQSRYWEARWLMKHLQIQAHQAC